MKRALEERERIAGIKSHLQLMNEYERSYRSGDSELKILLLARLGELQDVVIDREEWLEMLIMFEQNEWSNVNREYIVMRFKKRYVDQIENLRRYRQKGVDEIKRKSRPNQSFDKLLDEVGLMILLQEKLKNEFGLNIKKR